MAAAATMAGAITVHLHHTTTTTQTPMEDIRPHKVQWQVFPLVMMMIIMIHMVRNRNKVGVCLDLVAAAVDRLLKRLQVVVLVATLVMVHLHHRLQPIAMYGIKNQ